MSSKGRGLLTAIALITWASCSLLLNPHLGWGWDAFCVLLIVSLGVYVVWVMTGLLRSAAGPIMDLGMWRLMNFLSGILALCATIGQVMIWRSGAIDPTCYIIWVGSVFALIFTTLRIYNYEEPEETRKASDVISGSNRASMQGWSSSGPSRPRPRPMELLWSQEASQ